MWFQKEIRLPAFKRGFHLITQHITKNVGILPSVGCMHVFIKHTSAALTLNENADPSVRVDFETTMNKIIPENQAQFTHTLEGDDDMPAHLKSSIIGSSVTIPISGNRINLGTWQGIYLCEFRDQGGSREIVITVFGE